MNKKINLPADEYKPPGICASPKATAILLVLPVNGDSGFHRPLREAKRRDEERPIKRSGLRKGGSHPPHATSTGVKIDELVSKLVRMEGSDLHLMVDAPPVVRVHGSLQPLEGYERLHPADTENILKEIVPEKLVEEFEAEGEVDLSYEAHRVGRFRVNAFRQRGSTSIVMRFIPFGVPKFEDLNLPEVIAKLAREERGIILVTGTTGNGKSTTLASMINLVNRTSSKHTVTIEDPIEFLHLDEKSIINQREVGQDTVSYARALKRVLRQDPDIILIGEIRDSESAQIALSAAETGHLVLSTLHALDAT